LGAVAKAGNGQSVTLNADATVEEFVLSLLGNLYVSLRGVEAKGARRKLLIKLVGLKSWQKERRSVRL
ncbi:MAG: hypothetical protein JWQ88_3397, partial [Rhodoferax sp.]|nr:hypothetical protein [Rhodoferax sp.]